MPDATPRSMFISFPVADVPRASTFFRALGFTAIPEMTGEANAGFAWSDTIRIMAISRDAWAGLTTRAIPPADQSEFGHAITYNSREEVDAVAAAAAAAGGQLDVNPVEDHGFMYQRDVADPDGHIWGLTWMDMAAMTAAAPA
ncbi:MAG: lactoylglutathione lyase [Sphingomonadales bacterium]|nr:lactoylglutathione lyase [Sphingomonadales bacterium]